MKKATNTLIGGGRVVSTYGIQPMHGCFAKSQLFLIIRRIVQIFIRAYLSTLSADNNFVRGN